MADIFLLDSAALDTLPGDLIQYHKFSQNSVNLISFLPDLQIHIFTF